MRFAVDHVRTGYVVGVSGPLGCNLSSFWSKEFELSIPVPFQWKSSPFKLWVS